MGAESNAIIFDDLENP